MPIWRPSLSDILKTAAHQMERQFVWLRATARRSLGWLNPVKIVPYRGYGNPEQLLLMGRVLEDRPPGSPGEDDTWWQNLRAMYRRFVTDAIPDVRVRATGGGCSVETTTDREGYFRATLELPEPAELEDPWRPIELELLDRVREGQGEVRAQGYVLVPPARSRFGVISDVDDTIIRSYATDFLKMARITFLKNVRTRTPLPGVSRFYRALERNADGEPCNPFFYVSSSAWNLYDVFEAFLDLHDIPAGPILLRDLALDDEKFIKSGHEHKLQKIERIMETCPELPFVLVVGGDGGSAGAEGASR